MRLRIKGAIWKVERKGGKVTEMPAWDLHEVRVLVFYPRLRVRVKIGGGIGRWECVR